MKSKEVLASILAKADININGDRPWDLKVVDDRAYNKILAEGNLGLGESYMDGWIDCEKWDDFVTRALRAQVHKQAMGSPRIVLHGARAILLNAGSKRRAFEIGERHYDIGNDLYERMLDKRMTYTCGYWKDATTLDEAQEAKLDLVCRKVGLKPGMKVLDIGCGWGSFMKFAAEKYGVSCVGVTVSKEQAELASEKCKGLPIEILLQDYRDIQGTFDAVISLGMFEHVGVKNYRTYFEVANRVLPEGGLFLLHTIGGNVSDNSIDPWIEKYIFPGAMLPSVAQIGRDIENLFVMEDWHNFGPYYDKTLMAWFANSERAWSELPKYDERFRRMWRYYLLSCAGSFRARQNELWQIVLSKGGVIGGYTSLR